ncbi:imidazoleglycerol-phosphate dehydratase HisB [Candidatus Marinamargulisbacteria bacterium SCGC AAA071-K20]|nr:imidazoleglycerol-phosphate dehydratase HisB [Candidatus Marinamargulisbacteria bacterium SCGC AAA071-K20]
MSTRKATIERNTNETKIKLEFNIDGTGQVKLDTGMPFFDHMLDLFTRHGLFDLDLKVDGDLEIDFHHSVEDVGICLGQAFKEALADGEKINRYASGQIPMDESIANIAIDICNRPSLIFNPRLPQGAIGKFDSELVLEFFQAFVNNARIALHIGVPTGENLHHKIEACFKGFGIILDRATQLDPRKTGVPSTKGVL